MIINQAFKFRLYPKEESELLLNKTIGCSRFIWNQLLNIQKDRLDLLEYTLPYTKTSGILTLLKKQKEYNFLKEVPSQPLQQKLRDLNEAILNAFKKENPKGFPHFKRKYQKRQSFRYPIDKNSPFRVKNRKMFLPKIGWVKFRGNFNRILGVIKNVTVVKNGIKWEVSVQTEREIPEPIHQFPGIKVAGDLGIVNFLTLSNGDIIKPINSFKVLKDRLKRLQQDLSRKVKGSCNWIKCKIKIQNLHDRIFNIRHDYQHKESTKLATKNQIVILEDLNVDNMIKSSKGTIENPGKNVKQKSGLNRMIQDQSWSSFIDKLEYKLKWLGGLLIKVPPMNTSNTCHKCFHKDTNNRITQSHFKCIKCGFSGNADYNASMNILREGVITLSHLTNTEGYRKFKSRPFLAYLS